MRLDGAPQKVEDIFHSQFVRGRMKGAKSMPLPTFVAPVALRWVVARNGSSSTRHTRRPLATCCAEAIVMFRGREIAAKRNEKLRDVLLRADGRVLTPHNGGSKLINCRGLGTCGTCAVVVEQGQVVPQSRSTLENLRLSFPPHNLQEAQSKNLRLACQVRVVEDITIRKNDGFWGQGDEEQAYPIES